ncbi:hypothetical protein T01_12111 [Trichinella spiralis]|uniref:Uncharacterized protein n=1 Tax=Trichinella spiralis TaxID=6334 RepID=A0A0V1B421_TRISP|nr:hypothetical protein T01_12111 [Trichinella spiralis]
MKPPPHPPTPLLLSSSRWDYLRQFFLNYGSPRNGHLKMSPWSTSSASTDPWGSVHLTGQRKNVRKQRNRLNVEVRDFRLKLINLELSINNAFAATLETDSSH